MNLQPAVLETAALPIELHPCAGWQPHERKQRRRGHGPHGGPVYGYPPYFPNREVRTVAFACDRTFSPPHTAVMASTV